MNTKDKMENLSNKADELFNQLNGMRKEAVETICTFLGENNGVIDLSEDDDLCITYDGGNHPEYGTNPFSRIYSITATTKKNYVTDEVLPSFEVKLDEDEHYEEDRIDIDDLFEILDFLCGYEN